MRPRGHLRSAPRTCGTGFGLSGTTCRGRRDGHDGLCSHAGMTKAALIAWLACLAASSARASKPVDTTLTGCVVGGALYSIDGRAYRISTPVALDLGPFEGKGVALRGWLMPGDRFEPAEGAAPVVKQATCPPASLRLILEDQVVDLRVEATKAAKA